ncbi:type 2 isopentenyl-diphosphate Delta-isomerase [Effusibacillus dendaii]|uniref:Isopentenyl-diphosphate delta-isomerase n=1 Tax=Effusibacillus dendaii TaxID=2743772 RepID=A0A7I8D5K0_9BACL|nr:type 2 isopentenyl-diphosphate Delta-isomerase [Effusibacillus dendaii]BCJ85365.1 isopentenyl-diphosphate delta-isomerase [Effusibacillus dendaii]
MAREQRKLDHVRLALTGEPVEISDFDDIQIVHRSFPETKLQDCRIDSSIGGLPFSSPIFINAMTGGADATKRINRALAEVARETGVGLAVGSQSAGLQDPDLEDTYRIVRQTNPNGIIIANLSAASPPEQVKRAVDMIEADLLQLHINVPQEMIMPEGDRDFTGILANVEKVTAELNVPVIVKEVGFGMCRETYRQLIDRGVSIVDVGGSGGTNFISIENRRRKRQEFDFLSGWGQSTAVSLLEATLCHELEFVASGGIRHSLDMIKCMILGARAVGVAGPILRLLEKEGVSGVVDAIQNWHEQIRTLMTILGTPSIDSLREVPVVVTGRTKDWCEVRQIDIRSLAYGKRSLAK